MDTSFTVTCFKKTVNEKAYSINLHQDILRNLSQSIKDALADQQKRINVQGPLRKLTSAQEIEAHLQKEFPLAEVTEGVVKAKTAAAELKEAAAKLAEYESVLGKDELEKLIAEKMAAKAAAAATESAE